MILAMLGVLKAGGCYVPFHPSEWPAARMHGVRDDCGATVVLAATDTLGTATTTFGEHHPGVTVIDVSAMLSTPVDADASSNVASGVQPKNLCYMIYTSGSTGKPKGV